MAADDPHPKFAATVWDLHPETHRAHEYLARRDYRGALRDASERLIQRTSEMAADEGEERLSRRTGTQLIDGMFLMEQNGPPSRFAFNSLRDRNNRTEHRGLADLMRGLVNAVRNPLSHLHDREITPQEAFEWLAVTSVLHRRLDDVRYIGSSDPPSE